MTYEENEETCDAAAAKYLKDAGDAMVTRDAAIKQASETYREALGKAYATYLKAVAEAERDWPETD